MAESKKWYKRSKKPRVGSLKKTKQNNIDKPLARLMKKKERGVK